MDGPAQHNFASLRPVGPVEMFDRAVLVSRRRFRDVTVPSWVGGLVVGAPIIATFYLERIEGVTELRWIMGLFFVLAFWLRAIIQARAARAGVLALWPGCEIPGDAGQALDVVRTASVVALGLSVWLWILVAFSLLGPIGIGLFLPVMCLRGLVAPAWVARAGCSAGGGLLAFARAVGDSSDRRGTGLVIELLLILGAELLAVNLFGLLGLVTLLAHSLLGLDMALVDAFLTPDNDMVLLTVAVLGFVSVEPLRVSAAACLFVDARVRQDALDLRAAVDEAIRRAARRGGAASRSAAALLLSCLLAAPVEAQWDEPDAGAAVYHDEAAGELFVEGTELAPEPPRDPRAGLTLTSRDEAVQRDVETILSRKEFEEFEDDRGKNLAGLIDRVLKALFDWLRKQEPDEVDLPEEGPPSLPPMPPWVFLLGGGLLLLGAILYVLLTRSRDQMSRPRDEEGDGAPGEDPRERAPEAHLDDAALLAAQGRYRDAIRSLYLATLVALDRRRLIAFDPARTNWHYIREMPRGNDRSLFTRFTRMFDHKWYGDEPTSREDYRVVRDLADEICAPPAEPSVPGAT